MVPNDFPEVRDLLRPRLFGNSHVTLDALELGIAGRQTGLEAVIPAAPGVSVGLVVDDGDSEVRVSQMMLDGWGETFEAALNAALANAANRQVTISRVAPGVVLVDEPVFTGTVWLKPSLLDGLGVPAPTVVVTPTRGWTLAASYDVGSLTALGVVLSGLLEQGHTVESVTPCLWWQNSWVEVKWDQCGVDDGLQRRVTRLFADQVYARQKPLLEADLAARGEDVFVASHKVFQAPDGRIVSSATWPLGMEALLPKVDQIRRVDENLQTTTVSWDAALPNLTACGFTPERYRGPA